MLDGAYYYLLDGAGKSSTDLSKVTVSLMDINGVSMKDTLNLSAGKCTEGAKQFPKAGGSPPSKTGAPKTNTTVPATTPKPAAPAPTPVPVTAAPKVPVTPAPVTPAPETPAPVTQTESPAVPASTPAVPASTPTVTTSTPSQEQQTPAPVEYTPTPVEQTETEAPSTTGPVSEDSSYIDVLDCGKNSQQGSSNDQTQQSGVGGENSADSPDVPATVAPVEQGSDAQTPYQQSSGDGNNEYSTPEPTVQPTSESSSVGGEAENPSQDAPISQGSDDTLHGSDVAGSEDQNTPATEAPSSPKDCPM
ncbi:Carbohydrate-binding protein [Phytophthora cinnamomi]|uniref:Carbohydrate-binding protein n=1 Tax=Phytophthora cinnamomi TaxID=4785 RepID=UPI003559C62A|nr:Carbohydrate-binding protein [Phytophthora cinnamomi]